MLCSLNSGVIGIAVALRSPIKQSKCAPLGRRDATRPGVKVLRWGRLSSRPCGDALSAWDQHPLDWRSSQAV